MKKKLALLLALGLTLSACGQKPAAPTGDGGTTTATNTLAVSLASEPDSIDPALNSTVDGGTMLNHLFAGLTKWANDGSGKLVIQPDLLAELAEGVDGADGKVTYTYKLKDGLKWSDGKALTAEDIVFSWNRAASYELAADYNYMFEIIDGYDKIWETEDTGEKDAEGNPVMKQVNPDAKLNIKAIDEKTFEVTLKNRASYWEELMAFPTYFPVREDVVSNEAWATDPKTYIGNGPYVLSGWEHNSLITMTKNPEFHDASNVSMEKLEFYLSDDANNMLTNFKNGTWQLIDDVPTNEIANLKKDYPNAFVIAGQIGTYYTNWNINQKLLPETSTLTGVEAEKAQDEIRRAIGLLLDRNYIVENVSQGGQIPASSFVAMGMTEPDGTQFYQNAGNAADYDGYYNVAPEAYEQNHKDALEVLKKYYTYDEASGKLTDFPPITYLYNTNDGHKAIGEYIQGALAAVGITINLENQEWNTFLNTRKDGGFAMARNGWLADYNDPISFLDMWTTVSGNNDVQFGKGEHAALKMYNLDLTSFGSKVKVENGTWAETYDVLISTIKATTDAEKRYKMMHMAEDMLMQTGALTPLYYYTDLYMLDENVKGFYANPLGFKYFMHTTRG